LSESASSHGGCLNPQQLERCKEHRTGFFSRTQKRELSARQKKQTTIAAPLRLRTKATQ
jgi:hypothetical protein